MRFALVLLCLVWIAGFAQAQSTISIRSGEHDSFSRLTMSLSNRVSWKIVNTEAGARLLFENPDFELDTSSIFERIPSDRLIQARWDSDSASLQLDFNCDCRAEAFWFDASMLVLDLRDASAETPSYVQQAGIEETIPALPEPATQPQNAVEPNEFEGARSSTAVDLTLNALPAVHSPTALTGRDTTMTPQDPVALVSPDVRDQLLKQVGRAATQGLLTPRLSRTEMTQKKSQLERTTDPESELETTLMPTASIDHLNVTAQSSIDRDFLGTLMDQQNNLIAASCIKNSRIDVASWGNDLPFSAQISPLRGQLMGEFDKVNTDTAVELARKYLYFGFGAEALATLEFLPDDHPDRPLLSRLAQSVDVGYALSGPLPAGQLDCPSSAALWAAMTYQTLPRGTTIDTDAILLAFSGLPVHLRGLTGPILAERFLQYGKPDVSNKLLRIIERNSDAQSANSDLVAADLQRSNGDIKKADETLQEVIGTNTAPSAEALVQMIDQRFRDQRAISYELAQLAGAYAFEAQDQEIGPVLDQAYVRALAASGAFDQAFAKFGVVAKRLSDVQAAELFSDTMQRLSTQSDDMTFLRLALPNLKTAPDKLDVMAVHDVASRLLILGFAEQADSILDQSLPPGHFADRDRKILRAKTSLALSSPRRAIVELLGLDGPDVTGILADARDMVGEHNAAQYLYAAADDPQAAQRQAWLASDWTAAGSPEDPIYTELAGLLGPTDPDDSENTPSSESEAASPELATLARNREMLESSQSMRDTFNTLLALKPLPDVDMQ